MFRKRDPKGAEVTAPAVAGRERVLVVGDNPDSVELLVRVLGTAGLELARATNRQELFDTLEQEPPECLVLDVSRPGSSDALALLEAIRSHKAIAVRLTRVLLCANRGVSALFAYDLGADDVLVRPVHAQQVVRAVRELIAVAPTDRAARIAQRRAELS